MVIEITLRDGEKIYVDKKHHVTCYCMHVGTKIKMIDPSHGGQPITPEIKQLLINNGIALLSHGALDEAFENGKKYGAELVLMLKREH